MILVAARASLRCPIRSSPFSDSGRSANPGFSNWSSRKRTLATSPNRPGADGGDRQLPVISSANLAPSHQTATKRRPCRRGHKLRALVCRGGSCRRSGILRQPPSARLSTPKPGRAESAGHGSSSESLVSTRSTARTAAAPESVGIFYKRSGVGPHTCLEVIDYRYILVPGAGLADCYRPVSITK